MPEPTLRLLDLDDDDDVARAISTCAAALGWQDPPFDEALFRWKHQRNAFGSSLIVVAEDHEGFAAVRPFMQWRFRTAEGAVIRAVRAVDTATHPRARGRGLFRSTTTEALRIAHQRGIDFVFNTPNSMSGAGYLTMGWTEQGPIAIGARLTISGLIRTVRARRGASKRSSPTDVGIAAAEMLNDPAFDDRRPRTAGSTDHDAQSLRWRYSEGPIEYRGVRAGDGWLVFRLRARGPATELVITETIGSPDEAALRATIAGVLSSSGVDHALAAVDTPGFFATERVGPVLMTRDVGSEPSPVQWSMGDIEVF